MAGSWWRRRESNSLVGTACFAQKFHNPVRCSLLRALVQIVWVRPESSVWGESGAIAGQRSGLPSALFDEALGSELESPPGSHNRGTWDLSALEP